MCFKKDTTLSSKKTLKHSFLKKIIFQEKLKKKKINFSFYMVYNFISFPSQNMFYFFFKYFFCLQQKIEMLLCCENEKIWILMSLAIIEEFLTMSLWVAGCYLSLSSLNSQGREISAGHFTSGFAPISQWVSVSYFQQR